MDLVKLFETIDNILGEKALLKGFMFVLENGVLVVDSYLATYDDEPMFICDFTPDTEHAEPITFAAKGVEELREELEHYIK